MILINIIIFTYVQHLQQFNKSKYLGMDKYSMLCIINNNNNTYVLDRFTLV